MSEIKSDKEWRLSKSGFSIRTGWSDEKVIIAKYPYSANPVIPDEYKQWLENAELICELHNKHIK